MPRASGHGTAQGHSSLSIRYCARQGDFEGVRRFVKRGCNVDEQLNDGWTALMYSSDKSQHPNALPLARMLLGAGADPDRVNWLGQTALMIAIDAGNIDIVRAIIDASASLTLCDRNGSTALHIAAKRGSNACKLIVARSKDTLMARSTLGKTPLHCAILGAGSAGGSLETVLFLLRAGSDLSVRDFNGDTPLHAAAAAVGPRATDMAIALVEAGADMCALNNDDLCPAKHATRMGNSRRAVAMLTVWRWRRRWHVYRMAMLIAQRRAGLRPSAERFEEERANGGMSRPLLHWPSVLIQLSQSSHDILSRVVTFL